MVEVECNFLTPDHHVARGRGEWSTAGALAGPETESTTTLVHTVYNIKLQSGGQIELGNRVYGATLGARFDAADPGQEPIYSKETTRYLQDLSRYSSGHIHKARGTASVDRHGMPRLKRLTEPPSKIRHVYTPGQRNPGNHPRHTTHRSKMDRYPQYDTTSP